MWPLGLPIAYQFLHKNRNRTTPSGAWGVALDRPTGRDSGTFKGLFTRDAADGSAPGTKLAPSSGAPPPSTAVLVIHGLPRRKLSCSPSTEGLSRATRSRVQGATWSTDRAPRQVLEPLHRMPESETEVVLQQNDVTAERQQSSKSTSTYDPWSRDGDSRLVSFGGG